MSSDITVPHIFITRLHTEMPVRLRIFVWYFKNFIPRQHSPFLPLLLPFCRFVDFLPLPLNMDNMQADDQDNTRCPSAVTAESSSSSDDVTQRGQLLSQLLRNMSCTESENKQTTNLFQRVHFLCS